MWKRSDFGKQFHDRPDKGPAWDGSRSGKRGGAKHRKRSQRGGTRS